MRRLCTCRQRGYCLSYDQKRSRRAGSEYLKYPWGNETIDSQRANYNEKIGRCSPVGCFPSGNVEWDAEKGLWLSDMVGNVLEWCSDWKGYYPDSLVKDPQGPASGSSRVLRGGSWDDGAGGCRCACRGGDRPGFRDGDVGFRVVFLP